MFKWVPFIYFCLHFFYSKKQIKKISFMSQNVMPVFFCRSFIVSNLTFRSLIHFDLIFVYRLKNDLIAFFTCSCRDFPAPFVEESH